MGLRGRPPKPSVIEIAEGCPGKRRLNLLEPKPAQITEEETHAPPEHLSEDAKKWWMYYATILRGLQVLTEADLIALENLAGATADRIANEANLAKTGPLYKTSWGEVRISPLFNLVAQLKDRELKLLREFGMTPSSRTRVQMTTDSKKHASIEDAMCG
jgi:P27 family predicted phage terminase small subunit